MFGQSNSKVAVPFQGADGVSDEAPGFLIGTMYGKGFFLHKTNEGIWIVSVLEVKESGTLNFFGFIQIIASIKNMVKIAGKIIEAI